MELAGRRRVAEVLDELHIDPDTVLVIRDRTLVTREAWLADDDEVEVRPVISGGACAGPAGRAAHVPARGSTEPTR